MPKIETAHVDRMMLGDFEGQVAEYEQKTQEALKNIELARELNIQNLQRLEREVPHNDVLENNATIAFHEFRNEFGAYMIELAHHQQELELAQEQLDFLKEENLN